MSNTCARTTTAGGRVLAVAISLSAILHLLTLGLGGFSTNLFVKAPRVEPERSRLAKVPPAPLLKSQQEQKLAEPKPPRRQPMIFVETDSSQPTGELPENVKYYGKHTTVAANPEFDPAKRGEDPLAKGTQDKVPSTADVPFAFPQPPPPIVAPPPPQPLPALPPSPQPPSAPSLLSQRLPLRDAQIVIAEPPRPPAELYPADVRQHSSAQPPAPQQVASVPTASAVRPLLPAPAQRQIPSRLAKMTESSVPRRGAVSLNVKGTPFGVYDEKLVAAVARRWHLLLASNYFGERSGVVTIHFILKEDGTVHESRFGEVTVGAVLAGYCRDALVGSAPFEPFTPEMRAILGKDHRELDFTFYY